MAEDDRRKLDIPWATLLPMVAALAGIVAQYKPLVSVRPAAPSEKPVEVIADQDVDARLWQDPLGVVQKEKLSLDSTIRLRRHSTAALSERIKEGVQQSGRVLLLAVMLESGPYLEQAESRLRGRQAVLEGLSESGFIPIDGEHIGFVVESWPPSEEKPTEQPANSEEKIDKPADDRSLLFAWEQCRCTDDIDGNEAEGRRDAKNDFQRVFVLWLPAASFNPSPLGNFATLIKKLASTSRGQVEVRMIGPANSTGLQAMLQEIDDWKKKGDYGNGDELDGVSIFSARATASDEFLLGYSPPEGHSLEDVIEEGVRESNRGSLEFSRTILTDDEVLRALIEELPLHHVHVMPWRNWRKSWMEADHIVVLSEWDTAYGRGLASTFRKEAETSPRPPGAPQNLRTNIDIYRYMRGIDGRLPGDSPKNDKPGTSKDQNAASTGTEEATEGLNQSDFLRRLARRLKEDEKGWQRDNRIGVRAIGVLGSDIYDKLMVLRALRPSFPNAVFFTNNYDAHFERLDEWEDVHNLVIASPFGGVLSLTRQMGLAPFRDNDQTSMYAGTLRALGTINESSEIVRQPHLFEIGRNGAHELLKPPDPLSENPANQLKDTHWFLEWLGQWRTYVSLAISGGALLVMVGWITLSIVDRRKEGGGGLPNRLKRLCASTLFWLICGGPLIVLSVAMLAQWGDAVQEPLVFFSGISIWPSEMLRLIALLLAIHFMIKAWVDLKANEEELTKRFHLAPLPPETWDWRNVYAGLRRWTKEHPDWMKPDAHFTAKEAWWAYLRRNQAWPRFARVAALFLIYLIFSAGVFLLFGMPVTPARGNMARHADMYILSAAVLGMMLLTFYVVDAIRLNSNFIRIVTGGVTKWEPEISVEGSRAPPLTNEEVACYHDIVFVAARTEVVAPLIWYPLIVLAVMVMARTSFFDNWTWPPNIILVFALNALWAFGSAAFLRRSAEHLRSTAISQLQARRAANYKKRIRTRMFDELIAEIRGLKKGAFAPLSEQPFIRAIILPSGGLGLIAVVQRLLNS